MKNIKLSQRLQIIADFIEENAKVADVGTDHGYVPVYLSVAGKASRIIASDLNEAPLKKAVSTANEYAVENIEFRLADGLNGFSAGEVDTIIIAGMGGENISDILSQAPWALNCTLILQPMSKRERLGEWLRNNGLCVVDEKLAFEKGGIHPVLLVRKGEDADKSRAGLYVSEALAKNGSEYLDEYIRRIIKKLEQTRVGLEKAAAENLKENIATILETISGLDKMRGMHK